jgi:hypothetical protein
MNLLIDLHGLQNECPVVHERGDRGVEAQARKLLHLLWVAVEKFRGGKQMLQSLSKAQSVQ